MNDDIVTRLREWVVVPTNDFLDEDIKEAADEIERLSADRDRWKKVAKRLFDAHWHYAGDETWCGAYMSETAECDCGYEQLKNEYEKAVRDE